MGGDLGEDGLFLNSGHGVLDEVLEKLSEEMFTRSMF